MSISRRVLLAAGQPLPRRGRGGLRPRTARPRRRGPRGALGEPVSVTFWHTQTGANERALSDAVSRFNLQNGKNILLRSEYQGNAQQVFQKTIVALQAGGARHRRRLREHGAGVRPGRGGAGPRRLPPPPAPPPRFSEGVADLVPAILDSARLDGYSRRLLAFPFARSLAVQYYNEGVPATPARAGRARAPWTPSGTRRRRDQEGRSRADDQSTASTSASTPPTSTPSSWPTGRAAARPDPGALQRARAGGLRDLGRHDQGWPGLQHPQLRLPGRASGRARSPPCTTSAPPAPSSPPR